MPGAPDPVYVNAREVLLDALEALGAHRASLILVGPQATYFHTGEADIAVAPFTTDADVVIDPTSLADQPVLGEALQVLTERPMAMVRASCASCSFPERPTSRLATIRLTACPRCGRHSTDGATTLKS